MLRITTEDLRAICGDVVLSAREVEAIARLAYLAAEIDFEESELEQSALAEVYRAIGGLAHSGPVTLSPVSPLPLDDEERMVWVDELASELRSCAAAEAAYAIAYALVVSDFELAPIEGRFLSDMQSILGISDERAAELAAFTAARATPGVEAPAGDARPWRG